MRVIVFFDLPVETTEDKRDYRKFRKFLINEGFIMMQESIYCKLCLNSSVSKAIKKRIYANRPKRGLVQLMVITEKQYSNIEYLVGGKQEEIVETEERVIFL